MSALICAQSNKMKIGDLVKFRLRYATNLDDADYYWSGPALVIGQYPTDSQYLLWIVWCTGLRCVIDEHNYEVEFLSA